MNWEESEGNMRYPGGPFFGWGRGITVSVDGVFKQVGTMDLEESE